MRFPFTSVPCSSSLLCFVHGLVDLIETADGKQQLVQLIHLYRSVSTSSSEKSWTAQWPSMTFVHSPWELMRPLP